MSWSIRRLGLSAIIGTMLTVSVAAGGDTPFERSLYTASFEAIDLTPLQPYLKKRLPEASDEEVAGLLRRNLKFVYYNKLNSARFLLAPEPQSVADRIASLMSASECLENRADEVWTLAGEKDRSAAARLLETIADETRTLRRAYNDFFLEGRSSRYLLQVPATSDAETQLVYYTLQLRRISLELSSQLSASFLSPSPGEVTVGEISGTNINTLLGTLELLSERVRQKLSSRR